MLPVEVIGLFSATGHTPVRDSVPGTFVNVKQRNLGK